MYLGGRVVQLQVALQGLVEAGHDLGAVVEEGKAHGHLEHPIVDEELPLCRTW